MIDVNSQGLKIQTGRSAVGGMWAFLGWPLGQCYHLVHVRDPVMMTFCWTPLLTSRLAVVLSCQELLFAFSLWILMHFFSRPSLQLLSFLTLPYSRQESFPLNNCFLSHMCCPVQVFLPRYHSALCGILFCYYYNSKSILLKYPIPTVCCFKALTIFLQLKV